MDTVSSILSLPARRQQLRGGVPNSKQNRDIGHDIGYDILTSSYTGPVWRLSLRPMADFPQMKLKRKPPCPFSCKPTLCRMTCENSSVERAAEYASAQARKG